MIKPDTPACVLFDFDGVCADTERYGIELDREVYELYGINPTKEEMQSLVGTTGLESIPALFRRYGLTVTAQEFFAKRRDNTCIYRDFPLEAQPGLKEVLEDLRSRQIPIGLVSTTAAPSILFALDRLHLASSFDAVVTGDMCTKHKPEPDPYLLALKLLGQSAKSSVAIEDSPTGIHAAKAAGLYVMGYRGASIVQDISEADEELACFRQFCI
ncbi:MAG: HAD family phosphatase [Coriobacteriaceae bacterium]|jgi:beta-phosphoglucomutase|nr:MAG: HAD family phosphatase [Coriobacteriaceae bacterium]